MTQQKAGNPHDYSKGSADAGTLPMRCNIDSCACNIGLSHGEPDLYCAGNVG